VPADDVPDGVPADDLPQRMRVTRGFRPRARRDGYSVSGDIDAACADSLFRALLPGVLSAESDTVMINMAGVTFFDSAGVDVLLDLREIASVWGKDVLLVAPSEWVLRVIDLAGEGRRLRRLTDVDDLVTYYQL
jgi:anti-anti-sigma factor